MLKAIRVEGPVNDQDVISWFVGG